MVPMKSQQGTGAHGTECRFSNWQGCNQREPLCPEAKGSRSLPAKPVATQAALRMAVLLPEIDSTTQVYW